MLKSIASFFLCEIPLDKSRNDSGRTKCSDIYANFLSHGSLSFISHFLSVFHTYKLRVFPWYMYSSAEIRVFIYVYLRI